MLARRLQSPTVGVVPTHNPPEGSPLPETSRLWPDPGIGPWRVTLAWAVVDGRPECVACHIHPAHDSGPPTVLTASVVRNLKLAEMIAEDRVRMAADAPDVPGRGLRRSTAERLRQAAEVYRAAARDGRPPTKAVAEHFGIKQGNASNLVARARAAGFLPPTSSGVPLG